MNDAIVRLRNQHTGDGAQYRFARLSLPMIMQDMHYGRTDPGPGVRVPDFDMPTVDGGWFRRADLAARGPALLVFGSITCPVTDNAAPGLRALHARYGTQIRFVMVNVREAHPGSALPQPATISEKTAHARALRALHGIEFEVAVDDVDGTFHRALSPKPNSAYILGRDGTILFRAHWANDTEALAAALAAVVAGRRPPRAQSGGLVKPMLRMLGSIAPVLDRAGRGAWADLWRVAPPLAAMAFAFRALGIHPPPPARSLSHQD